MRCSSLACRGVGKSTVARHCALEWPAKRYVDLATVREVLRPVHPELGLSSYEVWRLAGGEATPENLIRDYGQYTQLLRPSVMDILRRSADEGATLVIEGVMMSPSLIEGFNIEGIRLHPWMLRLSDPVVHLGRLQGSVPQGSVLQKRLVESFPLVRVLQDYLEQLCRGYSIPVIKNTSLQGTVTHILASLQPQIAADH